MEGARPTVIESTFRNERAIGVAALAAIVLLCWSWIVPMALDMYGSMRGPSAWMMTRRWDLPHILRLFAMWIVMMIGMMLPSAAPTLLLYGTVVRRGSDTAHARLRVYVLTAGYLAIWIMFSLIATLAQRALSALLVLSPMMELQNRTISAALLIVAGVYQLTPFKQSCLTACRSPLAFIMHHWRPGTAGAFRMGAEHGFFCLGCCWALMLLLFVGGVMNLLVIAALTFFVLLEKTAPFGAQGGRLSGIVFIAIGVVLLLRVV